MKLTILFTIALVVPFLISYFLSGKLTKILQNTRFMPSHNYESQQEPNPRDVFGHDLGTNELICRMSRFPSGESVYSWMQREILDNHQTYSVNEIYQILAQEWKQANKDCSSRSNRHDILPNDTIHFPEE